MITKIDQRFLIRNMKSLMEYGLQLGKTTAKNQKQPIYPTPSGMNIKVPQSPFLEASNGALIRFRKDVTRDSIINSIPEGYTKNMGIEFVPESREDITFSILKPIRHKGIGSWRSSLEDRKNCIKQVQNSKTGELIKPAHFDVKMPQLEPHYYIDELWSKGKNTGTNAIKNVVLQSLEDPQTQGRVLLNACSIDAKTTPTGFYYKLGFRSTNPYTNEECAKWLAEGGKKENAPLGSGMMYLPGENVQHCLNYGLDIKG